MFIGMAVGTQNNKISGIVVIFILIVVVSITTTKPSTSRTNTKGESIQSSQALAPRESTPTVSLGKIEPFPSTRNTLFPQVPFPLNNYRIYNSVTASPADNPLLSIYYHFHSLLSPPPKAWN